MNQQKSDSPRIAVLGAPSPEGVLVRQALEKRRIPGERVTLYGRTTGEVVLSEYAGEARMIQDPDPDLFGTHALIFNCEAGELAQDLVDAAPDAVIIDLEDSLPEASGPVCVHLDLEPDRVRSGRRFSVPHPITIALAELLHPLERGFGVEDVTAVVMRPAADFGKAGVEELRMQTVQLLNFSPVEVETFGRQLAFNILPPVDLDAGVGEERRIVREVTSLVGWPEARLAVKTATAPIFHGHAIQLRFRTSREVATDEVASLLTEAGLLDATRMAVTPLDVTGESVLRYSNLTPDGLGGFWLWGVSGDAGTRVADQAVRLAARLFDL
jgi:aspartate-semialdehyde dehydrogenase